MVVNVGINGFGRIGRVIFRACYQHPDLEITAINDPAVDSEYICYLIKFDSTHGKFKGEVSDGENQVCINGVPIKIFHQKVPNSIPWHTAAVHYVVEASGMFTNLEKASGHLASDGVRRVIVTAPSVDVPMIILSVNDNKLQVVQKVISCASSTLYCLAPVIKVLEDNYGLSGGFITSIHAMTPSLKPLDGLCLRGKHWRDHRSIHQNIIPATTGACKALGKIIPQVRDKMTGLAFRVPIVNVSVLDITVRLNKNTSIQDIINNIEKVSKTTMKNIIKVSKEQAVSSDFIGDSHSCILDADSCLQLKPNFFKLICWYENEYSYACRVIDTIFFSEKQLSQLTQCIRSVKKQDTTQQTDCCINGTTLHGSHSKDTTKLFTIPSQEKVLKFKKPVIGTVTLPTTVTPGIDAESRKQSELFEVWNDVEPNIKPLERRNRNAFFHRCIALPPNAEKFDCVKAQERLERVKREFSKMVNITDSLLKNSNNVKFDFVPINKTPLQKSQDSKAFKDGMKYYCEALGQKHNLQEGGIVFDVSGDCKTSKCTIDSKYTEISKEEVRYNVLQDKGMSDYSMNSSQRTSVLSESRNLNTINQNIKNHDDSNSLKSDMTWSIQENLDSISTNTFTNQVVKTLSTIIDGISHNFKLQSLDNEINRVEDKINRKHEYGIKSAECSSNYESAENVESKALNPIETIVKNNSCNESSKTDNNSVQKLSGGGIDQGITAEYKEIDKIALGSKISNISNGETDGITQDDIIDLSRKLSDINEMYGPRLSKKINYFNKLISFARNTDDYKLKNNSSKKNASKDLRETKKGDPANSNDKKCFEKVELTSDLNKTDAIAKRISDKFSFKKDKRQLDCLNSNTKEINNTDDIKNKTEIVEITNSDTQQVIDNTHQAIIAKDFQDQSNVMLYDIEHSQGNNFCLVLKKQDKITEVKTEFYNVNIDHNSVTDTENHVTVVDEYSEVNSKDLDDELQRNIVLLNKQSTEGGGLENNSAGADFEGIHNSKDIEAYKCPGFENTMANNNISSRHGNSDRQDIYDKLDSTSATDSDNSFQINERKSQVLKITDITNSLDDLENLDKICRIIEISDELSDQLFSALDNDANRTVQKREWSFKDLCEKINLEKFCNKVFDK